MVRKRYSPKLKFQVVLEALSGEKTTGQIAKEYGIHPNSVALWKKQFLEKGPELFSQDSTGILCRVGDRFGDLPASIGKRPARLLPVSG